MSDAIWLSLKLALVTTPVVVVMAAALAWYGSDPMRQSQGRHIQPYRRALRHLVMVVVTVPIILPPTVLGFYLLMAMGAQSPLVALARHLHLVDPAWRGLAFSFPGLVIGSVVFCLPFAVQTLSTAFGQINRRLFEVAACLGAGRWRRFVRIALPLSRRALVVAGLLSFAHTLGEFGVILMIGGNIPGATRVVSIALYEAVEAGQWSEANLLAAGLVGFALGIMTLIAWLTRRQQV